MTMCADLGPILHKNVNWSGCRGGESVSPSRVRRRERRVAERAAAENAAAEKATAECAAVKAAAEKCAAEKAAAKKCAAEKAAAEKCAAAKAAAEKCAAEKAAAKKCAAEKASTEKCAAEKAAAEKYAFEKAAAENCTAENAEGASTSRIPSLSSRSADEELVLPLCHYCCHKGSGMNPVHYESMCICDDRDCSCACYCTEAQLEHRKLHFPGVWSEMFYKRRAVMLLDRPTAMAVAETRIVKWNGNRPCRQPSCLQEN